MVISKNYKTCRRKLNICFSNEFFLDVVLYSKSSYVVVVAIDFGTTYSGYAFSFLKENGKDSVYMNREWLNEQGTRTSKTPTCLLLKPDLSFESFGYQAIEKYADLQDKSNEQQYYFFQHFKMALHSDEVMVMMVVLRQ